MENEEEMKEAFKGLVQLAHMISAYYRSLISAGIPPEYAIQLTEAYQTTTLGGAKRIYHEEDMDID